MSTLKSSGQWSALRVGCTTASRCQLYWNRFPIRLGKCLGMEPTTRERVTKRCSRVAQCRPSCPGAWHSRAALWIPPGGELCVITPPADRGSGALCLAGRQWEHAPECRRECDVPVQEVIRGAALGMEPRHSTYRSAGEMRGAHSHDTVGPARGCAQGMTDILQRKNY